MVWKKQEGNGGFWNPEKIGDEVVGVVAEINKGLYGNQYRIVKDDKSEILTPSHKALQAKMAVVKENDRVKIVFIGEDLPKVKGQNPTKLYDVFVDVVGEESV